MKEYQTKPVKILAEEYKGIKQAPFVALVDKKHKEATGESVAQKGFTDNGKKRFLDNEAHWFDEKDLKTRLDKKHKNYDKNLELVGYMNASGKRKYLNSGDMLVFVGKELVDVIAKDDFKASYTEVKSAK